MTTLRKTTVAELSAEENAKKPNGCVFVATAFPIQFLTDAELLRNSLSDDKRSYLITTVPRAVAERSEQPYFDSYEDALWGIAQGQVRELKQGGSK